MLTEKGKGDGEEVNSPLKSGKSSSEIKEGKTVMLGGAEALAMAVTVKEK